MTSPLPTRPSPATARWSPAWSASGTGTNTWAKGGVMIRDSLNGGSTFADMVMTANTDGAAGNGASFQYRLDRRTAQRRQRRCGGGHHAAVLGEDRARRRQLHRLHLRRRQDLDAVGTTQTIKMTAPVYIGICVTSHQAGEQRTFQFEGISTTGSVTGSWQGAQINSPQYNDAAGLYAIVEDSSGKSKLVAIRTRRRPLRAPGRSGRFRSVT